METTKGKLQKENAIVNYNLIMYILCLYNIYIMKINENKFGGKVIASGGFGCVFSPALKCKGKRREKNKISKVMTKKHAIAEYNEIINIKKKLIKIPNYSNFFLVDNFDICEPEKLSSRDLENFKKNVQHYQKMI